MPHRKTKPLVVMSGMVLCPRCKRPSPTTKMHRDKTKQVCYRCIETQTRREIHQYLDDAFPDLVDFDAIIDPSL